MEFEISFCCVMTSTSVSWAISRLKIIKKKDKILKDLFTTIFSGFYYQMALIQKMQWPNFVDI